MMFFLQINIFFCLNEETLTLNLDISKMHFINFFAPDRKKVRPPPRHIFAKLGQHIEKQIRRE